MSSESVCGINKFVERDIDVLLAEELRVSPDFCAWIMGRFKLPQKLSFPAVSTSVSVAEGGEADVVATFQASGNSRHRLFVVNRIDAVLLPEQLARYIRRGNEAARRQIVSGYSILFCTPSSYRVMALPAPVQQMSFEDVAEILLAQGDLRSRYRGSFFLRALPSPPVKILRAGGAPL
ncbi:MAG: hypothetical protein J0I19_00260 [Alphaproteobacteria bacterium]|nr:hypothetical protein [Alphaproteobacteria bacterium]